MSVPHEDANPAAPHDSCLAGPTPPAPPLGFPDAPGVAEGVEATLTADGPPDFAALGIAAPPGYELLQELGRGGMGVVYRARHIALSRHVAVKLLRDDYPTGGTAANRFVAEARITGQLQHPGIPPVHEVGSLTDGRPFLAMKLIKGNTLDELLKHRTDPLRDWNRFVAIFEQVAQAVGYAHAHKVIHRDLKPSNVMVGAFGEVQVMDWGLAKVLTERQLQTPGPDDVTLGTAILSLRDSGDETRAGSAMGTSQYMPREQAIGAVDQVDERSDVFGLGGILCTILTGQPPYVAATAEAARQMAALAELGDAFDRLDRCGAEAELVALCKRCLSPAKADRPRNAGQVARAVAELRAASEQRARQAELDRVRAELLAEQQRQRAEEERIAAEKREREHRNRDALVAALERCVGALREDNVGAAAAAMREVEERLSGGGTEGVGPRVERCRRDLAMLEELDRIDDLRLTLVENRKPVGEEVAGRWAAAFAAFGITPGETPPGEAARRIAESHIREQLLGTLDQWHKASRVPALRTLLREVDPDPFRESVRDALAAKDAAATRALVERPEALEQPASFAVILAHLEGVSVERGEAILREARRRDPRNFPLAMALGGLYPINQREGSGEREKWYQVAVSLRPTNSAAWNNLGIALKDRGDVGGAILACREAIRHDDASSQAYSNLGIALKAGGDLDGAVAAYREAIRHDPRCAAAYSNLGIALKARGDLDGAIAAYREAIRHDPKCAPAFNNLGIALKARGDTDGAMAAYNEAIGHNPKLAQAHLNLGVLLCDKGDVGRAIAAYREAIKHNPELAAAHFNLGLALKSAGNTEEAVAELKEALRHDPKDVTVHTSLGAIYLQQKKYLDALACAREAVKADPTYPDAHTLLGVALQRLGDGTGARAAFAEATRLDKQ